MALEWNVYVGDFNSGRIEPYNVFRHYGFYMDCLKIKRKYGGDRERFAEEIRRSLMYYYWSKCEWETILTHWPDGELYEMRQELTHDELKSAMRSIGKEPEERWPIEAPLVVKVYLKNTKYRDKKIDVYEQVMLNWDRFIDYLWEHKRELKKKDG